MKELMSEKGCKLLTTPEELKLMPRIPKVKYIASCDHEHEVHYNVFKSRGSGILCPKCKHKENDDKRRGDVSRNINGQAIGHYSEEVGINYIIDILKKDYILKQTCEGCLADIALKPKKSRKDEWLQIQVKTTAKPTTYYSFTSKSSYDNCIILCICNSDKKMWIFDGNTMKFKRISIGLKKSKYDDNEVTIQSISKLINEYLKKMTLVKFDIANTPISIYDQKEMEFKKYREEKVNKIKFTNVENYLKYDFMINDKKVQEKVGYIDLKKNLIYFTIHKNNGKVDGVRKFKCYDIGDNDFYWLNIPDKINFLVFPEKKLIEDILKKSKNFCFKLETAIEKYSDYLFDYNNIDYTRLNKILLL